MNFLGELSKDDILNELTKIISNSEVLQDKNPVFAILKSFDKPQVEPTQVNLPWGNLFKNIEKHIAKDLQQQQEQPHIGKIDAPSGSSIPVDVRQMESYLAVYFEVPGVNKADITLEVSKNRSLLLKVDKQPYGNSSDVFLTKERHVGTLQRSIVLPETADTSSFTARYEDGVVIVKFKYKNAVTETQKIPIE